MNKSPHILYLSYDGMTDPLGESQVLSYLRGLSERGYRFTLVSFEKQLRFQSRRSHIQAICDRHQIKWIPKPYSKRPPVFSTLFDLMKMRAVVTREMNGIDMIHCRSYLPMLVALPIKRKFNVPVLFDMRGFWADERVEGKIWNLKNPIFSLIHKYFKRKEKVMLSDSEHIISLTENGKETMLNEWGLSLSSDKISVIPCCAEFSHFQLTSDVLRKEGRNALGLDDETNIICYLGSLGTWYLFEEMLDFFDCYLRKNDKSKFLIISRDERQSVIEKINTYRPGLKSDIILYAADREELPKLLAASDWSLMFIKPSYSKRASSPTKMGELLAMGVPLICNSGVGDVAKILYQVNGGISIDELNSSNMMEAIDNMREFTVSPDAIRESAMQVLSLNRGVESYSNVYQGLLNK